ncbi:MAG: cyclic nucleotide-binding domain-containing protein [Azonexus sp.]|nr:cyclic nucleotide-binding domain-containing protein [Azonexus sp.]
MQQQVGKTFFSGDFWGGLAATLVVLPASIAFGATIYGAVAPDYAAVGALAGVIGATVIGLLAALLGGTDRLISAPCAPAAAVLSAFAAGMAGDGVPAGNIVLLLLMLGILAGFFQVLLGVVGVGRLIRYIPYPVVSGYMTGVGLTIIASQIDKLLGASEATVWNQALVSPWLWDMQAVTVGLATILVTLAAPRFTKRVPGIILGIVAGVVVYFLFAIGDPELLVSAGNPLLVGPSGVSGEGYLAAITARWREIGDLRLGQIAALLGSALTLAVLLSIDTLKTCVVLDQITHSRHNPNRELLAQGVANVASSSVGGIPGAGTLGPTLVNLTSGATSRASGYVEGLLALIFALLLSNFIAWLPLAALAGILIVVGLRMIDRDALRFIMSPSTVLDFAVIVIVIVVALSVGLIAASGAGVALAILLFLREQIGGTVVRHKLYLNQRSSTWQRPEAETRILDEKGDQAVILELQGSLFFGTTQQLLRELEPEIKTRRFIILDFRRVQSIDITGAHMLRQTREQMGESGAMLLLSNLRENLPYGRNLRQFLDQTGVTADDKTVRLFDELDNAIGWVEDQLLDAAGYTTPPEEKPLELAEMALFRQRKDETLIDLEARLSKVTYPAGATIYARGQTGEAIYLIRRGSVKMLAPLGPGRLRHVATFGRSDFFGGLAFLDGHPHNNDAVAASETELFVLTVEQFNLLAEEHKRLAITLLTALSRSLAHRLRHAENEIAMLHEF